MGKNNLKIIYDPEVDVLSWELSKKAKIDYASELGNIVVHFTKNNLPVLVEILEASHMIRESAKVLDTRRKLVTA